MTKIYYSKNKLQNNVIVNLEKGIVNLNRAKLISSTLNIPEFSMKNELRDLNNYFDSSISEINHIIDWIKDTKEIYEKLEDEINSNMIQVNKLKIDERKMIVN